MRLSVVNREAVKKREAKRLRRSKQIPAVLYARKEAGETIAVDAAEFAAALRQVTKGHLPTTIFTLIDAAGKERKAIVKDIQYNPVSYDVIHLDFEELLDEVPVSVKVPIECTGVADCVGTKLGGVLRLVIRHVKVRCLPKDLPQSFKLDVRNLNLRQTKRLSDIEMPHSVRPLMKLDEVAVIIAKR
jgi:large subunit ribosomal protein L25